MEITSQASGDFWVLRLNGRLDASWCPQVESALAAAIREGKHRLHVDMAAVSYLSSAGVRVLLTSFKQLQAINGRFGVIHPSEAVRSVLELSGLQMLITGDGPETASSAAETGEELNSAKAQHRIYALGNGGMRVEAIGDPGAWQTGWSSGESRPRRFGRETLAIGIGALGAGVADAAARCGEFLAVGGVATFQPSDGSNRPDFVVSEASLIPEGHLFLGLSASGGFSWLDRFEANPEARTVGMSELAETALQRSGASAVAIAVIAETAGLVGAALRQAPGQGADWLQFPEIRERLSFTSERAFRDSTTLIGGVIAKSGTALDPWLRPMGRSQALLGHLHGAAFTYRPLRKGRIELGLSVQQLFDGPPVQAVLHLLADPRGFHGAGESEFQRGAIWIAPLLF